VHAVQAAANIVPAAKTHLGALKTEHDRKAKAAQEAAEKAAADPATAHAPTITHAAALPTCPTYLQCIAIFAQDERTKRLHEDLKFVQEKDVIGQVRTAIADLWRSLNDARFQHGHACAAYNRFLSQGYRGQGLHVGTQRQPLVAGALAAWQSWAPVAMQSAPCDKERSYHLEPYHLNEATKDCDLHQYWARESQQLGTPEPDLFKEIARLCLLSRWLHQVVQILPWETVHPADAKADNPLIAARKACADLLAACQGGITSYRLATIPVPDRRELLIGVATLHLGLAAGNLLESFIHVAAYLCHQQHFLEGVAFLSQTLESMDMELANMIGMCHALLSEPSGRGPLFAGVGTAFSVAVLAIAQGVGQLQSVYYKGTMVELRRLSTEASMVRAKAIAARFLSNGTKIGDGDDDGSGDWLARVYNLTGLKRDDPAIRRLKLDDSASSAYIAWLLAMPPPPKCTITPQQGTQPAAVHTPAAASGGVVPRPLVG
jgi:hypothetical protein